MTSIKISTSNQRRCRTSCHSKNRAGGGRAIVRSSSSSIWTRNLRIMIIVLFSLVPNLYYCQTQSQYSVQKQQLNTLGDVKKGRVSDKHGKNAELEKVVPILEETDISRTILKKIKNAKKEVQYMRGGLRAVNKEAQSLEEGMVFLKLTTVDLKQQEAPFNIIPFGQAKGKAINLEGKRAFRLDLKIYEKRNLSSKIIYVQTGWILEERMIFKRIKVKTNIKSFNGSEDETPSEDKTPSVDTLGFLIFSSGNQVSSLKTGFSPTKTNIFRMFVKTSDQVEGQEKADLSRGTGLFHLSQQFKWEFQVEYLNKIDIEETKMVYYVVMLLAFLISFCSLLKFIQERIKLVRGEEEVSSLPLLTLFQTLFTEISLLKIIWVFLQHMSIQVFPREDKFGNKVMNSDADGVTEQYSSLLWILIFIIAVEIIIKLVVGVKFYMKEQLEISHGAAPPSFYICLLGMLAVNVIGLFLSVDTGLLYLFLSMFVLCVENIIYRNNNGQQISVPVMMIVSKLLMVGYFYTYKKNIGLVPINEESLNYTLFFFIFFGMILAMQKLYFSRIFEDQESEKVQRKNVGCQSSCKISISQAYFGNSEEDEQRKDRAFKDQKGTDCSICFDLMKLETEALGDEEEEKYCSEGDIQTERILENEPNKKIQSLETDEEIGCSLMLTGCNHLYHKKCLDPWIYSTGKCPICKDLIMLEDCRVY